jgi:hypothetical protein
MKRFCFVLFVLLVGIVVFGFYRGWFYASTGQEGQKANLKLSVDKEKLQQDEEKAVEKVRELGKKIPEVTGGSKSPTPQEDTKK